MAALRIAFGNHAPDVDDTAWTAPNATLVGNVTLGAHASVWYGATIRAEAAPVTIGERSNIQDGCVVHVDENVPAHIGNDVSVGHGAVLHGCVVEDDCLIGMGATVLNGARIGAGSIVAAGTVVLAGMVVPPGSLVAGVPGKVRRRLTDADIKSTRDNATIYVALARAHAVAIDGEKP